LFTPDQMALPALRKTMNPIQKFESCAQTLWASDLEPKEKATRLKDLAATISQYLSRVAAERKPTSDPWATYAQSRSLRYLRTLAEDIDKLAESAPQA